jgi:hypothetical protein
MSKVKEYELNVWTEYVKVHGLQRAGTNYLAHLVNENFLNVQSLVNVGGWKHGHYCAPWTLGQEVHILIATKNPYAWLVSLYKYWQTKDADLGGQTFDAFVRGRAVFERASGTPFLLRAANPVQHWNDMNYHWLSIRMNEKKVLAVPYEALLLETDAVLNAIGTDLGLERSDQLVLPRKKLLPGNEEVIFSDEDWQDRDYYLKEKFLKAFTPELIAFVNSNLDKEVVGTLGYSLVKED